MADAALLITWGYPVRGREAKSIAVFNEAVGYWTGLQQQGQIESFEVALAEPNAGGLGGFALLRGSVDQVAALHLNPEFQRVTARAQLIVDDVAFVTLVLGQRLMEQMALFQQQVSDLA